MPSTTTELIESASNDSPLGYSPLLLANADTDQALMLLRGVSTILDGFAETPMKSEPVNFHDSLYMLSCVLDAAHDAICREVESA